MSLNEGLFTSLTGEWETPQYLFDSLNEEFKFTLDVCATKDNAKCSKYYDIETNGLDQKWEGSCFMNPPYGRDIDLWLRKAYESSLEGALVVCLIPSRTDTRWWHEYVMRGEIRFLRGRLKFGKALNSAPFPSAVVVFRPREKRDEQE